MVASSNDTNIYWLGDITDLQIIGPWWNKRFENVICDEHQIVFIWESYRTHTNVYEQRTNLYMYFFKCTEKTGANKITFLKLTTVRLSKNLF